MNQVSWSNFLHVFLSTENAHTMRQFLSALILNYLIIYAHSGALLGKGVFSPFLEKALLCTIHRILNIIPIQYTFKTTRIGNLSQFKCQGLNTSSKEQDAVQLFFWEKKDFI